MAPPSQQGTLCGAGCLHPSVCCLVGQFGQLFTGQQGLHHLSHLGCHCRAYELLLPVSDHALSQAGPQEVRPGGKEALRAVGTTQSPVLLTKIYSPLTRVTILEPPLLLLPSPLALNGWLGWGLHSFFSYLRFGYRDQVAHHSDCTQEALHWSMLNLH